jgi:hypothetical protein
MEVENFFDNVNFFKKSFPIMVCDLPPEIVEEIKECVILCDRIKDHRLAMLLNHKNAGHNSFQVSLPRSWFLESFLFPYLIKAGEYYFYKDSLNPSEKIRIEIQDLNSNYFNYGVWLNYSFKGDFNNLHHHYPCYIVGVIYVENTSEEPTVFEDGFEFFGKPGQMIVFPGMYGHGVRVKKTLQRRLTIAFNLNVIPLEDKDNFSGVFN